MNQTISKFNDFFNLWGKIRNMDTQAFDKALQEIVKKRTELEKIDYNNPKYDDLEEQLHDLEDAFSVKYGEYLEDVLQDVHDELCPDNDILFPTAYIKGVPVEIDKYAGKETILMLEANPPRITLTIGKEKKKEVVWTAK
jgi:hypothetical protein